MILVLLLAVSVAMVWRPWAGVDPVVEETFGWPAQLVRGVSFGVDFVGGSKIMLRLESSHVTVELPPENTINAYETMLAALVEKLSLPSRPVPVDPETDRIIDYYEEPTRVVTIEIGLAVEDIENLVRGIISDCRGELKRTERAISVDTREEIIHSLKDRVDPLDVLKIRFRPMGADFLLFEMRRLEPVRAKALLGHQGRLEVFIENKRVLFGDDITHVDPVDLYTDPDTQLQSWCVPFGLSTGGAGKWKEATTPKDEFVGCPTGIYLDRPRGAISGEPLEAVLILSKRFRETGGLGYRENERMLYLQPRLPLLIRAVEIEEDLPLGVLENLVEKARLILLGERDDFENVIPPLEKENLEYSIEGAPGEGEGWLDLDWVKETCGLKSAPGISRRVAGEELSSMVITTGGTGEADRKEAELLRDVLARRLPVGISYESETYVDPRFGKGFLREAILAALVAIAGVWALIYFRYKHPRISLALTGTMLCEFVITVGIAAILGLTLELPELGGLIIVIGTGVDHQIIITDELLRGGLPTDKRISLRGRAGRALAIIFAAAATTIAAMLMLGTLGFGLMRGFAIITIMGTLVSILVTRPVYARMAGAILAGGRSRPK